MRILTVVPCKQSRLNDEVVCIYNTLTNEFQFSDGGLGLALNDQYFYSDNDAGLRYGAKITVVKYAEPLSDAILKKLKHVSLLPTGEISNPQNMKIDKYLEIALKIRKDYGYIPHDCIDNVAANIAGIIKRIYNKL